MRNCLPAAAATPTSTASRRPDTAEESVRAGLKCFQAAGHEVRVLAPHDTGARMLSPPQAGLTERQVRFEALYTANHAPILGFALRRTASPDDAADILAETFLTAWRRLDELPAGDDARLWLYGVARRVLANYYRG